MTSAPCLISAPAATPASLVNIFIIWYIPINCFLCSLVIPFVRSSLYRNFENFSSLSLDALSLASVRYSLTSSIEEFIGFTPSFIILRTVSGFIFLIRLLIIALTDLTVSTFSFVISMLLAASTFIASLSSSVPSSPSSLIISSALPCTAFFNESPRSPLI